MKKQKIFITGAGSGLGKMAALALARRGHTVYASVQYENQINSITAIAQKENLDLICIKLDILLEADRQLILGYDIDVFIANSAIGDSGSVAEIDINKIKNVFETNVFSNIQTIQLALKNMILKKHQGRIIIISSLVGRIPIKFLSPYCASKFALEGFFTCLRQELKMLSSCNIDVLIIEPGAYATGFNLENVHKKYAWMEKESYFNKLLDRIKKEDKIIWNILEQKSFNSIIRKYVKAVETKFPKKRYTAPWWQALGVQIGRIFGM